jgi:hypothetical protein
MIEAPVMRLEASLKKCVRAREMPHTPQQVDGERDMPQPAPFECDLLPA